MVGLWSGKEIADCLHRRLISEALFYASICLTKLDTYFNLKNGNPTCPLNI